ncbi:serine hydrolase [Sphingomonas sp. PB4P5]|uniref:serine hydrolase n=1 Tax=Parasphingomonas puruogangriensis TaxID=3096155 RepID=UPI002FC9F260
MTPVRVEQDALRQSSAVLALALILGSCGHGEQQRVTVLPKPLYQLVIPVPAKAVKEIVAPQVLAMNVAALGANFPGKLGIAVKSIDEGWTVQSGGTTRLPQQSVSKLWVAMTVLDFRDQGRLRLDDPVTVRNEDLTLFHQPSAMLIKGDGWHTTVGELLQRALTMSDNLCNDRLLHYVGGPSAVRSFIARKGLGDIRFGPGERDLQSGTAGLSWKPEYAASGAFERARAALPAAERVAAFQRYVGDPPDGAAPIAIAGALAKLKKGEILSAESTRYLIGTMESSRTGKQRLRGAVPAGWSFGHKTGTGQDLAGRTAGYNDVGILIAPDGRSYSLAVMIGDTPRSIPERQHLMQAVVMAVVLNHH